MMRASSGMRLLAACLCAALAAASTGRAQDRRPAKERPSREEAVNTYAAKALLKKAGDLLTLGETDRGVKMLETIVEQYAETPVRYEAYLALGKHFIDQRDQPRAITVLRHLRELEPTEDREPTADERDLYLEGLYLTGVAYFQMKQYGSAFPILRKITTNYPNTVWANQAFYYIGMCHFAQGNWNKSIEALGLVGTFVDPNSPTVSYVEAGRRFYVKIEDGDLPILYRLGKTASVDITTANGDKETVQLRPLGSDSETFLASMPTAIGKPAKGDGTLQVIGGDKLTTTYVDTNTKQGRKDVKRANEVEVVSTASLTFTMGTYESKAPAAFVGQPLHVMLQDVDQDVSDKADKVLVKVISRYKVDPDEAEEEGLTADLTFREEQEYKVRDEVMVQLTELGEKPVHSGQFANAVPILAMREDQPVIKNDKVLTCDVGDEVLATYVDDLHIGGRSPRTAKASINVAGEITSRLATSVNYVSDPVLRAKKALVEGSAYLELARIFASMGLKKGASEKATEGLERVDSIIRTDSPIPSEFKEQAFKLRWNLYLTMEDYKAAMATCNLFNRLYPDSPFVDQAMMGIADIRLEEGDYRGARGIYSQVLRLPNSLAKAEAQFRIAQLIEREAEEKAAQQAARTGETVAANAGLNEQAIQQYKLTAERYPESQYAGESLGKLVDYYLQSRDYTRANDLLEQIFEDYPDANFLDSMLLKWVYVAYRMGDYQKAKSKCTQLIFEYPASDHAAKAKKLLPAIEAEIAKSKEN